MSRTNIEINDALMRKARKLTRRKTKRQVVDKALELLVRSAIEHDAPLFTPDKDFSRIAALMPLQLYRIPRP